jgi:hypothetical protein
MARGYLGWFGEYYESLSEELEWMNELKQVQVDLEKRTKYERKKINRECDGYE